MCSSHMRFHNLKFKVGKISNMLTTGLMKVCVCSFFLIYSCISDWRSRKVQDKVWLLMGVACTPVVAYEFMNLWPEYAIHMAYSLSFMYILSYSLYRIHAFGGADAKALITLAYIFPVYPTYEGFPVLQVPLMNLFAFSTLANAALTTFFLPVGLLLHNLSRGNLGKLSLIGYKMKVEELKGKHVKILEYVKEDGCRKISVRGFDLSEDEIKRMERLIGRESEIWVTPKIPFMIPITLGFFLSFIVGDMMFELVDMVI